MHACLVGIQRSVGCHSRFLSLEGNPGRATHLVVGRSPTRPGPSNLLSGHRGLQANRAIADHPDSAGRDCRVLPDPFAKSPVRRESRLLAAGGPARRGLSPCPPVTSILPFNNPGPACEFSRTSGNSARTQQRPLGVETPAPGLTSEPSWSAMIGPTSAFRDVAPEVGRTIGRRAFLICASPGLTPLAVRCRHRPELHFIHPLRPTDPMARLVGLTSWFHAIRRWSYGGDFPYDDQRCLPWTN